MVLNCIQFSGLGVRPDFWQFGCCDMNLRVSPLRVLRGVVCGAKRRPSGTYDDFEVVSTKGGCPQIESIVIRKIAYLTLFTTNNYQQLRRFVDTYDETTTEVFTES